jgi:hypothetical protein
MNLASCIRLIGVAALVATSPAHAASTATAAPIILHSNTANAPRSRTKGLQAKWSTGRKRARRHQQRNCRNGKSLRSNQMRVAAPRERMLKIIYRRNIQ